MKLSRLLPMKRLLLAIAAMGAAGAANAQYTNYFTNQVFSTNTTTSGTFNGNSFSIATSAGTIATYTVSPGSLPSGSGYPATGPTAIDFKSPSSTVSGSTVVTFTTPLTPADHFYFDDFDNGESATLTFRDNSGVVINPSSFRINHVSTTVPSGFSATAYTNRIEVIGTSAGANNPMFEVIPNVAVKSITLSYITNGAGSFGMYFGRNIPILSHSLSSTTIGRGRTTTLTYTLSGINNNPISNLGFVNNLPSGWKIAPAPAATGTLGTLSATGNGSTVTLSGVNNSFTTGTPLTSASWSVDITTADNQLNSSCASNPAAYTNGPSNFVASGTTLSTSSTPVCLTVVIPLPLELSSFTAAPAGCDAVLRWETAYESQLAGYEVERSSDGQSWMRIGRLQPGNKGVPQQYHFTDERAPEGSLHYRLRILDLGGATQYSPVASLRTSCAGPEGGFSIAPNPAHSSFSCSFGRVPAAGAQISARIVDLSGRLVATLSATSLSGAVAAFSLPPLPAGLYILHASVDGRAAGTGKLVVQ